jgi:hypothetical protein
MPRPFLLTILGVLAATAAGAQPQQQAANAGATQTVQTAPSQTTAAQDVPDGGAPAYIRPETPEQRKQRLGTPEDPGTNPDPSAHYWRFGRSFHISKYERRLARYDREPGTVRPIAMINIAYEVYQQNEKWVWVWVGDPLPEEATAPAVEAPLMPVGPQYAPEHIAFFKRIRSQFFDLTPPPANKTVQFVESSEGLPVTGSWRNSLAVADMNDDGFPDLIAPPERGGRSTTFPSIFLGDGKGHWRFWSEVKWPGSYDYGSVAAADLNRDGHQDLVLGVHLRGVFVLLGDGKGHFTAVDQGLPRDFPTRRVLVTDIDKDRFPDIVAVSEGPTSSGSGQGAKVRAYMNKEKGKKWQLLDIADPLYKVGGDWATTADFNGDSYPDFLVSTVFDRSGTWTVYESAGLQKWKVPENDGDLLPMLAYYGANASGKFTPAKKTDAIISYMRYWPGDLDGSIVPVPQRMVTVNIDRLVFGTGGLRREPIIRWGARENLSGLAVGDFDGDGNDDIIYTRHNPREAGLLLADGKGGFTQAAVAGLPVDSNVNYDLRVADVNGDRKPDVIVMYESAGTTALADRDGSIHVFLSQGARPTAAPAAP